MELHKKEKKLANEKFVYEIEDSSEIYDKIMAGFDPLKNLQDRRIFYEVTGLRLDQADFRGEDTDTDDDLDEDR